MKFEDKVALLNKYKESQKLIRYYQNEIEQYRESKAQAKAQQLSAMPTAHGNNSDLSDYMVKLEELQSKAHAQLLKAENLKTNIAIWCESLTNVDERLIIKYHYIQCHNFGWIADEMHFGIRTVMRKRKQAINHLPEPNFDENGLLKKMALTDIERHS